MEHAGLFPPLLATCLPAQPAPTPAPPSARPAEPTRIITDPLSGRSYCKGRLLGKVPIGVGVVGGSAVIRCGREPPPGSEERGLSESPPFRSSGSDGSAGPGRPPPIYRSAHRFRVAPRGRAWAAGSHPASQGRCGTCNFNSR